MKLIQQLKPCSLWLQSLQYPLVWDQHINFILLVSHCNTRRCSILWWHQYCNMPFWHRSSDLTDYTIQFPIYMEAFADLQLQGLRSARVDGFLCLTLLDFVCFLYWLKWYNLRSCWCAIFSVKTSFLLLILFAFFAVRESFACEEILDKHKGSPRLVAGDLMACSSDSYQAEITLVLHNVSTHLSGTLHS